MGKRVHTACRDCKRCTNSAATNAARATGRAAANLYTFGAVNLFSKMCKGCDHAMSLHNQVGEGVPVQPVAPAQSAPPARPVGWYLADPDGRTVAYWDGYGWGPATPTHLVFPPQS